MLATYQGQFGPDITDSTDTQRYRLGYMAGCDVAGLTVEFRLPNMAQAITPGPEADEVTNTEDGASWHRSR